MTSIRGENLRQEGVTWNYGNQIMVTVECWWLKSSVRLTWRKSEYHPTVVGEGRIRWVCGSRAGSTWVRDP